MAYTVNVNGIQIFGNNETYPEWDAFIRSQGIEISKEGFYKGEIRDFMAMLETVESITLRIEKERVARIAEIEKITAGMSDEEKTAVQESALGAKSIFDFTNIPGEIETQDKTDKYRASLFDVLTETINRGYAFLPVTLYMACRDKLEKDNIFAVDGHFECYKVRDGESIHVSAG